MEGVGRVCMEGVGRADREVVGKEGVLDGVALGLVCADGVEFGCGSEE